ncbi:hypothetical protein EUX98_g6101 [Antrodiella citrinella]|uniref:Cytochrome P450 n=1 Tax=Antrodiella citrinella TaxID=2447956 RepID=A0A4S4MPU4_9APHY|nr:hypothetical protein EUX98_g6101 [Antrodiella citrinella]
MDTQHLVASSQPTAYAAVSVILLLILCHAVIVWKNSPPSLSLPPGPKQVPFVGNALQLPMGYQERTFLSWGRTFGAVVHAKLFQTSVIIVNSVQVAKDLMDKKSENFSDRPRFALLGEVLGLGDTLPLIPYGDKFRRYRRWFHDAFLAQGVLVNYRPLMRRELSAMLKSLITHPNAYETHFFRYNAAIVLEIAYGHRVTSDNDSYVDLSERAMHAAACTGSAGSMLVDVFPILKHYPTWMPGSGFKIQLLKTRELLQSMLDAQYNVVKNTLRSGGVKNASFASNLLEAHYCDGSLSQQDDTDIRGASGTLYAASTESMSSVMRTFILAMVLHHEVFKKAQEELDRVVGPDRLPDWEDRDNLPYLVSVMKEVYRWNVPVPLAVPHVVGRDDVYQNFKIPAKSLVIGNIWGMSKDESLYPDPDSFKPERFLEMAPGSLADPKNMVFGFGRR